VSRLLRDPIARVLLALFAGLTSLYFLPGVPHEFLQRIGDRYSTLPLWPWAAAACVVGLARVGDARMRRFWSLQGASFVLLLAIELPWAMAANSTGIGWYVAAEWCFLAFYGAQLVSAMPTTRAAAAIGAGATAVAAALTWIALRYPVMYNDGWPSYGAYLALDLVMAFTWWRRRASATGDWRIVYGWLLVTSIVVFGTDVLDLLWYNSFLPIDSGQATDILWMLPPLAYGLTARAGRLRLESGPR
jgi:hypothetical protein